MLQVDYMDKECSEGCLAAAWALEQYIADGNITDEASKAEATDIVSWLYSNPLELSDVVEYSLNRAVFILGCLTKYGATCDDDSLIVSCGDAKYNLAKLLLAYNNSQ